jgi:integrase
MATKTTKRSPSKSPRKLRSAPAKAARKTATPTASASARLAKADPSSKQSVVLGLLRQPKGASIFGDGPRREGGQHRGFSGWSKSKAALDARILAARKMLDAGAKPLPHWTVHDLRRTAATAMADQLSVLPHIVEAILNHVSGHRAGVAGVYNRARYQAEMRDALERWTEHLVRIVRR